MPANPFFEIWETPFGVPPFVAIRPEHFRPAYDRAFAEHAGEISAIAQNAEAPSFSNTILALEKSGHMLSRIDLVFFNLASSDTNDELQAIERDLAPLHARHWNAIHLNADLFRRIDDVFVRRGALNLDAEEMRLLERYHLDFLRAGASLQGADREHYAQIGERLAELGTSFGQNVLADEQEFVLPLTEDDLEGLPDFVRDAAASLAKERKAGAPYIVTTSRSSAEPFLQFSARRDLREQVLKALETRGNRSNSHDNKKLIAEVVKLRADKARLLGYATFADYRLDDTMARTPDNARILLDQVWAAARGRALIFRPRSQKMAATSSSPLGTGATTPKSFARNGMISTRPSLFPTCNLTG
jgi:peptidyl-dipeptidase Dcp